jgi:DNA replication protein DnaC
MKTPTRYKNAAYADVPEDIKKLFEKIKETQRGIYIWGGVGIGKTHIAYSLLKGAEEVLKVRAVVINLPETLHELREDAYRQSGDKLRLESDLLQFRGLLIIDDIGAEKITDWVGERIYLIINKRYTENLPTIFTSNLPIADLADRIGDRATSRIVEMCNIIKVEGEDRRLKNNK